MNTIQRLADARNCLEGKIVAVALSLLMALSFLNVSVFADAALAVEGFDGEVGEKTTEPTPPENDPEKTSESVSTPTNDGASETPGQKDDGSLDSSTSDGLQNYAAALTVDTDDVTVKLTAAGALPEGARLTVDVAENDEGKTAMEKALEEGYGLYRIYRLGLVDESGDPLTLSGIDYRVTVTWRGTFAGEMKAYRIDGPETVTEITLEKPLTTQGDINPNALTFSTELLNAPFAFAMPTSEKEGDKPSEPADPTNPEQPVIPGDENIGEGDGDNVENGNGFGKEGELPGTDNGDTDTGTDADADAPEQPAPSEPAANKPVDDSDNEHQLTLYVGEVRDLHRFAASGGTWASENPAVAEVATTGKVTAVAPGDAVVRCGEVTINVTVRPALTEDAEGPQLAYFYFLPPSENGLNGGAAVAAGSDMSGATFLGSGAAQLPSGYDGHSALLNGTVLPLSKDANGNEIRNNYDVQVVPGTLHHRPGRLYGGAAAQPASAAAFEPGRGHAGGGHDSG
ncbi:MAG: Ig-like domain-containing protein [Adlercreutzia sp.]|nr:Ig-like domain-containing protein [Adlercreutzia sp.]